MSDYYKCFAGFTYRRRGMIAQLDFKGFVIYTRVGGRKNILGIRWGEV